MMKWGMWSAQVTLTALVFGWLLRVSAWGGWHAWVAWVVLFVVTAWWEYIMVISWEHWTAIEMRDREQEKRERDAREHGT